VDRWLDVAHPWRSAWSNEVHARTREVINALLFTSNARLNLALVSTGTGTGNFGDHYSDRGFNDPAICR
jgi:hypothetical protein